MRKLTIAVAVLLLSGFVYAAPIWQNAITGNYPGQENPYTTDDIVENNLLVSGIGRSGPIGSSVANNRYNTNSWNVSALDDGRYLTFTLTPSEGHFIHFTDFDFYTQKSATGPTQLVLRSSLDGFATDIYAAPISATDNANVHIVLPADQFLNVNVAVEFRLYAWGASAGTGTFSINSFSFNGMISETALPVLFGEVSATQRGDIVHVIWSTLSETNNKLFEVEGSTDGVHFKTLKTVVTQNGNSGTVQYYEVSFPFSEGFVSLQWIALLFFFPFVFKTRKKILLALIATSIFCLQWAACTKHSVIEKSDAAIFIRIKQIDVDNEFQYSKTVRVISNRSN